MIVYLYLGADVVVVAGEVVAILDPGIVRNSDANRRLVERALATGGRGEGVLGGCRALVVTGRGIFASPVSPQRLARRMESLRAAIPLLG